MTDHRTALRDIRNDISTLMSALITRADDFEDRKRTYNSDIQAEDGLKHFMVRALPAFQNSVVLVHSRIMAACQYKSPHTIKNWLTIARNDILHAIRAHSHMEAIEKTRATLESRVRMTLVVSDEIMDEIAKRQRERRHERATQVITMRFDAAKDILNSMADAWREQVRVIKWDAMAQLYACMMTGRRPTEVRTWNFRISPDNPDTPPRAVHVGVGYRVMEFMGQAKTRKDDQLAPSITIPVLDEIAQIERSLTVLDMAGNRRHPGTVFEPLADQIGWPQEKIRLSPKAARAFYACFCSEVFRPFEEQDWHYVAAILGHNVEDTETCQTYRRFEFMQDLAL